MRSILCVGVLFAIAGHADVTLRYSFDIKPGAMLPPQAVEAMKQQIQMPMSYVIQTKGSRAYADMMGMKILSDFETHTITILDPKNKRFATTSGDEYIKVASKPVDLPPEAREVMESMKFDVQTRATGRSEVINGFPAEEREVVLSMEMPAGPQGPMGPMRMVLSFWGPKPESVAGNPALRELAQYTARAYAGMNPADMMDKLFAQLPGMGEKLRPMMEETRKMQAVLRMRGAMFMPGLAAMMPGVDASKPFMEINMDLQELSTAELPDSTFQVPADYKAAPLEEVMKSAAPKP